MGYGMKYTKTMAKMTGEGFPFKSPLYDHNKDKDGNIIQHEVDPDAPGTPGTEGYEPPVESIDYLTKTPVGPVANPKPKTPETPGDVDLAPGFEDPIKIQKVQRDSQESTSSITKPKTPEEIKSFKAAQLETKGSDERETERINE